MSTLQNNLSLKQRRLLSGEIAKEYHAWKRKLHREPTEDERRQIVAIGFSKARHRRPDFPEANPGLIDAIAGLGYLVTKPEGVVMGPAEAVPMLNGTKDSYPFAQKEEQYRGYTVAQLLHAKRDAGQAAQVFRGQPAEGWYMDDVSTISLEIARRQKRSGPPQGASCLVCGGRATRERAEGFYCKRHFDALLGIKENPSLPAMITGSVVGSFVANALSNPGERPPCSCGASGARWVTTDPGRREYLCVPCAQAKGSSDVPRSPRAGEWDEPHYPDGMLNPVVCPICRATASSIGALRAHLRRAHENPLNQEEVDRVRHMETTRIAQSQRAFQAGRPDDGKFYDGIAQGMRTIRREYRAPGVTYTPNPGSTEPREDFGLEGTACSMCGGPLMFLGTLGMADHYQCRNCGHAAGATRASDVRREYLRREFDYGENPGVVTLHTKAHDNHGHEYEVQLVFGNVPGQITLDVVGTSGKWYLKTLLARGGISEEIYIDFGQGWKITNFGDVMREAVDTLKVKYPWSDRPRENPLLMTVMGANPGAPRRTRPAPEENPRRRGRKVTMSLQEFAKKVKSANDPALWNNFLAKIRGYQKWSHGTLPSKVTVEQVDVPGVKGMMIMFDMGKQPESTYIMPDGTKRKGAWKHPWDTMPDMKGDGQAGIIITKLKGKNKLTDFLHG